MTIPFVWEIAVDIKISFEAYQITLPHYIHTFVHADVSKSQVNQICIDNFNWKNIILNKLSSYLFSLGIIVWIIWVISFFLVNFSIFTPSTFPTTTSWNRRIYKQWTSKRKMNYSRPAPYLVLCFIIDKIWNSKANAGLAVSKTAHVWSSHT